MAHPDPGGLPLGVGANVTIHNESSVDTDCSMQSAKGTKRRICRPPKICKHCNKRRRKHASKNNEHDCQCAHDQADIVITDDVTPQQPAVVPPTTLPTTTDDSNKISYRKLFNNSDVAPFVVHVQRIENSPNDGSTLHPVTFGRFIKTNGIKNIANGSIKRIGRNRVSVGFSNYLDANNFINLNTLTSSKLKAFIPTQSVTRIGIVRGVPAEWSEEEIKDNMNLPIGCGEILKIRRLNYKVSADGNVSWKPTQSVVITFDGQVLPKYVYMYYNALKVELYVFPTIQCHNCCRFGHTRAQCRSKPRCFKCGNEHTGDTCEADEFSAFCITCSGCHFATNKACPEWSRQKQIKISMAESCVSYLEAAKLHPPVSKSYADILKAYPSNTLSNNHQIPMRQTPVQSTTTSYKKTIFKKPRLPPTLSVGYNQREHNSFINDYNNTSANQNGSVLNYQASTSVNTNENNSVNEIISLLSKMSTELQLPSHVAPLINLFLQILHGSSHSMELPKRNI